MLALFGTQHLDRVEAAYAEAARLPAGWPERIGLHQLHPLLVHAVTHGPSYGHEAGPGSPALRLTGPETGRRIPRSGHGRGPGHPARRSASVVRRANVRAAACRRRVACSSHDDRGTAARFAPR